MPLLAGMVVKDHLSFGETITTSSQLLQRVVHHFIMLITNEAGATAETGPITVEYRPINREEKQRQQLAGITLAVIAPPHALASPMALGGIAAGAGTLLALGGWQVRRRRRRAVPVAEACIEDAFLQRMTGLKALRLQGDTARYFAELEAVLRDYAREKYQIGSLETYQPAANGAGGFDARSAGVARELLALAHTIRYGGQIPSEYDQTRMHDFVHTLLDRNRPRRHTPEELDYLTPEPRS
jgi:hypothetical protein